MADIDEENAKSDAWNASHLRPRYRRGYIWIEHEQRPFSSADWSEIALSIPPLPESDMEHITVTDTLRRQPHLFKVVTPIKADVLQALLVDHHHPNTALVKSVCDGFRKGFWPYAVTSTMDSTSPVNNTYHKGVSDSKSAFLLAQRDEGIALGQYSESFGTALLPGMISQPISTAPKPGPKLYRLINDYGAGTGAPNSFVHRDPSIDIHLDSRQDFVQTILAAMEKNGGKPPRYIFKSDVSKAYRCLPMHPRWQLRQIVKFDDKYHVDRCGVIGGKASGDIFCQFMSLVAWLARTGFNVEDLLHYIDDNFSYEYDPKLAYYPRYHAYYPKKQVRLLFLWDRLGIPHEKGKQEFGESLVILGMQIDLRQMTIDLPGDKKSSIVKDMREFAAQPQMRSSSDCLRLYGLANWAVDFNPLLKPALASLRAATSVAPIIIDGRIKTDLLWFAEKLENSSGIRITKSLQWDLADADMQIFCDASALALGIFVPSKNRGLFFKLNGLVVAGSSAFNINPFEQLAIISALDWASQVTPAPRRLVIHTDSLVTASAFDSLSADDERAEMLLYAAKIMMDKEIDLRVRHVPGSMNVVADALSRLDFGRAYSASPGLKLVKFEPPQDAMRWCGEAI